MPNAAPLTKYNEVTTYAVPGHGRYAAVTGPQGLFLQGKAIVAVYKLPSAQTPSKHIPGSAAKIEDMILRYMAGLPIFNDRDYQLAEAASAPADVYVKHAIPRPGHAEHHDIVYHGGRFYNGEW